MFRVNGTLTEIDGMPVLRVWGTPRERGYAHGFLLAEQIVPLADGFLGSGDSVTPSSLTNSTFPSARW